MTTAGTTQPNCSLCHAVRQALRRQCPALYLGAAVMLVAGVTVSVSDAKASVFPPVIELRSLYPAFGGDGSEGFVLLGIDDYDLAASVSGAGDVNGDGIDDVIIGAQGASPHGRDGAGESYVVFGRTTGFQAALELRSLDPLAGGDGSAGFVLKGIHPDSGSGGAVSGTGDLNGDGTDDLMIGASDGHVADRDRPGEAYVVFGRTSGFPAAFELRSLDPLAGGDGSEGFILLGLAPRDGAGSSISGVGDVNGDGIDDAIIGALLADRYGLEKTGRSYLVFGRTSGFPAEFPLRRLHPVLGGGDGTEGFVLRGGDSFDYSGLSVSGAGDVNGDGIDDVIVGAPGAYYNVGASYVVFGRTGGFPAGFELRSLHPDVGGDGSEGFILNGMTDRSDSAGHAVSSAGDVNGDGVGDLLIGNYRFPDTQTYVVFGRTSGFPPLFELSRLDPAHGGDGQQGFILQGIDRRDCAGCAVSGAGDVNADGIEDLLIGALGADHNGQDDAGEIYIVFGRTTGFPASFQLSSLMPDQGGDGSQGFILNGFKYRDSAGASVSDAGDVNGDGIDDVIIGAHGVDANGRVNVGAAYVLFGRPPVEP